MKIKLNEHNLCRENQPDFADALALSFISLKFNLDHFLMIASSIIFNDF